MDSLYQFLGDLVLGAGVALGGYLFSKGRGRTPAAPSAPAREVLPEDAPVDMEPGFGDVKFSLQRHKHVYDTMFGDGVGMRCGIAVEPGVICGRPRFAKRGTPVG